MIKGLAGWGEASGVLCEAGQCRRQSLGFGFIARWT